MTKKIFFLDTNILLHDPQAFFNFPDSQIMLHLITVTELESFKKEPAQRGYNAREAIRILDDFRSKGSLVEGVPFGENSSIVIYIPDRSDNQVYKTNDDGIIAGVYAVKKALPDAVVTLISKDFAMKIKASLLGILVDDYQIDTVSKDNFYQGWKEFYYPSGDMKHDIEKILKDIQIQYAFTVNEFALIKSSHRDEYYRLFRYVEKDRFIEIYDDSFLWGIKAKNPHQQMILNLLLDDSIQLITIFGPSGTGKTFLVLATMLYKVLCEKLYKKLLVSRPLVPLGNDIGYLPGDLYEKLQSWMQPIKDNLDYLLHYINEGNYSICPQQERKKERFHKKGKQRFPYVEDQHESYEKKKKIITIEDLVGNHGKVMLEAITYMRGRSLPFQVIFIDEVQNLTPHEVKTLISRAGEGSKVILVGDPYQIDSAYLDFVTNGLVVATEKFKGQSVFGSVYLKISERSILSALANELM
jgi:PhoH-like ATPase